MTPKIRKPASDVGLRVMSKMLRRDRDLAIYTAPQDSIVVRGRHRPAIALYDSPAMDDTGRWVWTVCLGAERDRGVTRALPIRRFDFPGRGDPRYEWLFTGDWGGEAARSCLDRQVDNMMQSLERSIADTLGPSALVYVVRRGQRFVSVTTHRHVNSTEPVLVLSAEVAVFQDNTVSTISMPVS